MKAKIKSNLAIKQFPAKLMPTSILFPRITHMTKFVSPATQFIRRLKSNMHSNLKRSSPLGTISTDPPYPLPLSQWIPMKVHKQRVLLRDLERERGSALYKRSSRIWNSNLTKQFAFITTRAAAKLFHFYAGPSFSRGGWRGKRKNGESWN